ncbi:sugar transferase [Acidipila rosea]|uniref:Undecaprenyl-phosphate galactose phosphotransferase WbaP n=1 Tax=Acidipila rosea TaxID=768535 RepID=A0A4R1LC78_9BACT|nr:sugar transferase [Acidipila rosea]MBW4028405.1 sugar transferase [Acidobacteriota bacterium]MBW4046025.1 sugar transferase [Acidobacteriota bacterium]TCK75040.1 Undecaprenyl-phosphate galactose phosphotransferase WbaP [Acidipila rosea]
MALSIWTTRSHPDSQEGDASWANPQAVSLQEENSQEFGWESNSIALEAEAASTGFEEEPDALGDPIELDLRDGRVTFFPARTTILGLPTQNSSYRIGKRIFDLTLTLLTAPIILPLLASLATAIALTSGAPVFYRQRRIGQHGKVFEIIKFRTMKRDAEQVLGECLKASPEARREWQQTHKLRNDPRITTIGRFLRKTSLDELPQIFNVLRGEMTLVGPRPIVHAECSRYAGRFAYYTAAVPGVTGLWQVSGRCDVSYATRVRLDEHYVRNWSLLRDVSILLRTPRSVICRRGAY